MKPKFLGIIPALCILTGCYTTFSAKHAQLDFNRPDSGDPESVYRAVRSRWTVFIGSGKMSWTSSKFMPSPGTGASRREGVFPLSIAATLMNSDVVEAGLRYYSGMATMTQAEYDTFRQTYLDKHNLKDNILVEVEANTLLAENYLDLSRYLIYLEDETKNQQPVTRIEEAALPEEWIHEIVWNEEGRRPRFVESGLHRKRVLLYFPRKDFYGKPTIRDGNKILKLVFRLEIDGYSRAEAIWSF